MNSTAWVAFSISLPLLVAAFEVAVRLFSEGELSLPFAIGQIAGGVIAVKAGVTARNQIRRNPARGAGLARFGLIAGSIGLSVVTVATIGYLIHNAFHLAFG
jgi:hypothetical protein